MLDSSASLSGLAVAGFEHCTAATTRARTTNDSLRVAIGARWPYDFGVRRAEGETTSHVAITSEAKTRSNVHSSRSCLHRRTFARWVTALCPRAYCYHRTELYSPPLHTGGSRNSGSEVRRPMVLRRLEEWLPIGPITIPRVVCIRDPTGKSPGHSPCQGLPRSAGCSPVLWTGSLMGSVPKPGSHAQPPRKLCSMCKDTHKP